MNADVGRERWLNNDPGAPSSGQTKCVRCRAAERGREVREQADEAMARARRRPSEPVG
jgi:hypothetical protein